MVITVIISFVIGSWFGLAAMALFIAGANEDKAMASINLVQEKGIEVKENV